jgi:hypothetical protein
MVRSQVIHQNYICFVYLSEACFSLLRDICLIFRVLNTGRAKAQTPRSQWPDSKFWGPISSSGKLLLVAQRMLPI